MNPVAVSIIVPAHNEASRLDTCLSSIVEMSRTKGWQALVVDDGSTDETAKVARGAGLPVIRNETPQGVAAARNLGANRADGDVLVFVDADVVAPAETLEALVARLVDDAGVHAVGAWPEVSDLSPEWSARFVGLRAAMPFKIGPRSDIECFSAFQSECGAIRRETFQAVGGFPDHHRGVGMEEFEMGHTLERLGYRNVILADAHYYHHFKPLGPRCRELYRRTRRWVPLLLDRGRLESTGAVGTGHETLSCGLSVAAAAGLVVAPFHAGGLVLSASALAAQGLVERRFLALARRTCGPAMALYALPALQCINLSIAAGFAAGLVDQVARGGRTPEQR